MHKLKVLGLALVVIGALSAAAANSACAEYHINNAAGGSITASKKVINEFGTDVGTVKCSVSTFSGSLAAETAAILTVHPTYSGCTLGGLSVTISTAACSFILGGTVTPGLTAPVSVECGAGNIVIRDSLGLACEVKVPTQTPSGGVTFTSVAGGTVSVAAAVSNIKYSWTASCPSKTAAGGTSEPVNIGSIGTYSGEVTATGTKSGGGAAEIMVT
ncbi:MAG TPA: hypothetical protein VGI73_12785 [Solirubrobacterales bacterium]|jgi:hypothetical protein